MNINQLRQEYPEYADFSDHELADGYREKFHPESDQMEFYGAVGLEVPETDGPLSYSVDRAQELVGQGIQTVEDVAGFDTQYGQSIVDQQKKDIEEGGYEPKYKGSLFEQDGVLDMGGWLLEKTQENAATSVPALAGAAAAAVTAPFSVPAALVISGGTAALSGIMGAGEVAQEMKDKGVYSPNIALAGGAVIAILDRVGASKVLPSAAIGKLIKAGMKKEVAQEMVSEVIQTGMTKEIAKRAFAEGATETMQESVNVIAASSQGAEYTGKELAHRAADSFALGGTMGAGFAGVSVPIERAKSHKAQALEEAAKLTPDDEASPIANEDMIAGRQDMAGSKSREDENRILSEAGFPSIDSNITVSMQGHRPFKGKVTGVFDEVDSADYKPSKSEDEKGNIVDGFLNTKTGAWSQTVPEARQGVQILMEDGNTTSATFDEIQRSGARIDAEVLQITDELSPSLQDAYADHYSTPEQLAIEGPAQETASALPKPEDQLALPPSNRTAGDGFVMGGNQSFDPLADRPSDNAIPLYNSENDVIGWYNPDTAKTTAIKGKEKDLGVFEGEVTPKAKPGQKALPAPERVYGDDFTMGGESQSTPEQAAIYNVKQMPAGRQVSLLEIARLAGTNKKQASKIRDTMLKDGIIEKQGVKYIVKDKDAAATTHAAGYGNKQQQVGILERAAAKLNKKGITAKVTNFAGEARLQGAGTTPEQNKLIQEAVQAETQSSIGKAERMKTADLTKRGSYNAHDLIKANGGLARGQLSAQEMEQFGLTSLQHVRDGGLTLDEHRVIAAEEGLLDEFSSVSDYKNLLADGSNKVAESDINKRLDEMDQVDPEQEAAAREQGESDALKQVETAIFEYDFKITDGMKKEAAGYIASGSTTLEAMDRVISKLERDGINNVKTEVSNSNYDFDIPFEWDKQNEQRAEQQEKREEPKSSSGIDQEPKKAAPSPERIQKPERPSEDEGSTEVNENPELDEYAPELTLKEAQDAMQGRYPHKVPSSDRKAIAQRFKTSWDQFTRALDEVGYKSDPDSLKDGFQYQEPKVEVQKENKTELKEDLRNQEIGEAIGAQEKTAPEDTEKKRTLQQMRADAPMRAKVDQDGDEGGLFGTKDLLSGEQSKPSQENKTEYQEFRSRVLDGMPEYRRSLFPKEEVKRPDKKLYGYDAVELSKNYTMDELTQLMRSLESDPDNWQSEGVQLYDKKTSSKLDKISWAITYKIKENKNATKENEVKPDYDYSGTFSIEDYTSVRDRMFEGDISAAELKDAFESLVRSEDAIKAELKKLTIKQLGKYAGLRYSNEKKAEVVRSAYSNMEGRFHVGDSISYMMGTKHSDAVRKAIEKQTDEDVQSYAEKIKEQRADYSKRLEEMKKSVENPETFEEFREFVRIRGRDALSPEQQETYDELRAEKNRDQDKKDVERSAKVATKAAEGVEMEIVAGKHTKKGYDIFTVKLSGERLDKEPFSELKSAAKKLDGYYSSFRGNGAIPGFVFTENVNAEKFMDLRSGEVSAIDIVEKKADKKVSSSAEKLRSMADDMEAKANESLNTDRRTNTSRQAAQAASSSDSANSDIAMAKTMRNIADAIESGDAKNLGRIQNRTQIETLHSYARRAMFSWASKESKRIEAEGDRYVSSQKIEEAGVKPEQMVEAKLPLHGLNWDYIYNPVNRADPKSGYKRDLTSAEKLAKKGEKINVSNLRHMEIINSLMAGYSEEFKYSQALDMVSDLKRLNRMGIRDLPSLRAALREYLTFKGVKAQESKLTKMERDLIGRNIQGFFPTPRTLIDGMIEEIGVSKGMDTLEPEAGKGDIADAMKEAGANVDVVEVNYTLQEILKEKGHNVIGQNMLELSPSDKLYDRIVMNPPFEKYQDVEHVQHAYSLLKPGGKLAAIMSSGPFQNSQAKAKDFRDWLDGMDHTAEKNEEGSFKGNESFRQTGVNTYTVTIEKPDVKARVEDSMDSTPEFEQSRDDIVRSLQARLKGLGLDGRIALNLFKKITFTKKDGTEENGRGFFNPEEKIIAIALNFGENLESFNHEAVHALRNLGLFTKGEWNTLVKAARADKKAQAWVKKGYSDKPQATQDEEAIAEMFAGWVGNKNKRGFTGRALAKIENFFKAIAQALRGEGFTTMEDLFSDIDAGKIGARTNESELLDFRRPSTMMRIADLAGESVSNFKKWFGDSKVVDKDGKPLVVYHGTNAVFNKFRASADTNTGDKDAAKGFFFSSSPAVAETYVDDQFNPYGDGKIAEMYGKINDAFLKVIGAEPLYTGSNGQILPVYISMQNPFTFNMKGEMYNSNTFEDVIVAAKESGHDGVIIKDVYDGGYADVNTSDIYIPFRSSQIKSAHNDGSFSSENDDIMARVETSQADQDIIDKVLAPKDAGLISKLANIEWRKMLSDNAKRDTLITQFVNRMHPLAVYEMARTEGNVLRHGAKSVYKMAEMAINDGGRIGHLFNVGALGWNADADEFTFYEGKGLTEIFSQLSDPETYKKFQIYAIAKRANRLKGEARENLLEGVDIELGLSYSGEKGSYKGKERTFEQIFNDYQKFNKNLLEGMGLGTGMLSQEQFDFYTQHMDYVPFYRHVDETGELPSIAWMKKQINNPDAKINKLVGGRQKIGDLMENVTRNAASLTAAGMRNVVMGKLHDMAMSSGEGTIVTKGGADDGVLTYSINGNPVKFKVEDPAMVAAVASMKAEQLSNLMQAGATMTGILRNTITAMPGFMIANLERGFAAAYIQTGKNISWQNNAVTGLKRALWQDESVQELKAISGTGDYSFGGMSENVAKNVRRKIGAESQNIFMKGLTKAWAGIEYVGMATELADRDAIMQNLMKEEGMTKIEAAYQAMNLINYSRHGASKSLRNLTLLVPFLNARIQGLYRMGETKGGGISKSQAMKGIAYRGSLLMGFSLALQYMMRDDDRYDDEPLHHKLNYWTIYGDDWKFSIPKPFEFGAIFGTMPELIVDAAYKRDGKQLAEGLGMTLMNTFAFNAIPQPAKPLLENMANYNFFTTRSIESAGLKHKRPGLRAYSNTSDTLKAIGDVTDTSPLMMENLIRGYTAGVGMGLLGGMDAIGRSMGLYDERAEGTFGSLPVFSEAMQGAFGRFYKTGPDRSNKWVGDLYDLSTSVKQIHDNIKTMKSIGDVEAARELYKENKDEISKRNFINKRTQTMSKINKRIKAIQADKDLSKLEKRTQINRFVKMRNNLAEKTVKFVKGE